MSISLKKNEAFLNNVSVVGLQWGDEGKGKFVDLLAENASIVARFQGSNNAGHTIVANGKTYKLSIVPSGILHSDSVCVIGCGVALNPDALCTEIAALKSQGVEITSRNLKVSDATSLLLPFHKELDIAREKKLGRKGIGTTGRGNGPAYEDKAGRVSIRVADLYDHNSFDEAVERTIEYQNLLRYTVGLDPLVLSELKGLLSGYAEDLEPYVTRQDEIALLLESQANPVLLEGAQGALLDNTFGTYPFVTSSNVVASHASTGLGVSPDFVPFRLGVIKAYQTRVGAGPFPTELEGPELEFFVTKGNEFGTNTGRKRRCGWLDLVLMRSMVRAGGINALAITKLDILDALETVKVCKAYELDGQRIDFIPSSRASLQRAKPVYSSLSGWSSNVSGIRSLKELPKECMAYIEEIENFCEIPVEVISTSPKREDTIIRGNHPIFKNTN